MIRLSILPRDCIWIIVLLISGYSILLHAEEKAELPRLMEDIDMSYKAVERMSGYYKFSKKDWNTVYESGVKIAEITKTVQSKFGRPDNPDYQKLLELMGVEAQKMADIAKDRRMEEGALEDVQWQVRRLRHTCADCHKLLKIHIYPQLYPQKENGSGEKGEYQEWGQPE